MTAAPISAADREKAKEQRIDRDRDIILEAINTYDDWMLDDDFEFASVLHRIIERMRSRILLTDNAIPLPAFEARVVELEAALAAADLVEQELQSRISQLSREKDVAIQFWKSAGINTTAAANARADISEARATALLKALRVVKYKAGSNTTMDGTNHPGDSGFGGIYAVADAAINAGASNDR